MGLSAAGQRSVFTGQRAAWLSGAALVCWMVLWWYLCHGPLGLGAHRWDDSRYVSRAVEGAFDAGIRDRYVHVWGLRLFHSLFSERLAATLHYAATMGVCLIGLAFALGRQVGGLPCGLLAAALLPLYPPVLRYFSAPMTDIPSVVYGGLGLLAATAAQDDARGRKWVLASGVLCFASFKCKESGLAVVPSVLWVLAGRRRALGTLGLWMAGVGLGQAGLCAVDMWVTGDPFQSFHGSPHTKYARLLADAPRKYTRGRNLKDDEWLALLLAADLRGYVLAAIAGLALGLRRKPMALLLAMWGVVGLLFSGFVTYRYSGIDARVRYLAIFALPLSVGFADLLVQLFSPEKTLAGSELPERNALQSLLYLGGTALSLWFAKSGIAAGVLVLLDQPLDYPAERAHFFLLPLLVPSFLFIAWSTRSRWVRGGAALVVLAAALIAAVPTARNYIREHRRAVAGWHVLAHYLDQHDVRRLAHLSGPAGALDANLVQWRSRSMARHAIDRQRVVAQASDASPDELLVVPGPMRAVMRIGGRSPIAELRIGQARFTVYDRPR